MSTTASLVYSSWERRTRSTTAIRRVTRCLPPRDLKRMCPLVLFMFMYVLRYVVFTLSQVDNNK